MSEVPNRERVSGEQPPPPAEHGDERAEHPFGEALRIRNLGWMLRATALCALVATVVGVVIAPALRGYGSDAQVVGWDRAATVLTYAVAILAAAGAVTGATELAFSRRAESVSGALVVSGTSLVVVLVVVAGLHARRMPDSPPPWQLSMGLALVASSVASTAAWRAMAGPHTRALAIVISAFALAALLRVGSWELARAASERGGTLFEELSHAAATVAVIIEALGQAVSAAWIGSRSRVGLVASSLAAACAFAVTWGAAWGVHADAPWWTSALHAVLGESPSLPAPYALSAAQSFLAASSIFLAAAALVQLGQPAALTSALVLALLSRGAFDAPIRAIAIVTAASWTFCAAFDQRLLWYALAASRERVSRPTSPESIP
jgi:hypothetical protein